MLLNWIFMASRLIKPLAFWIAASALTACASSLPPEFQYETSVRSEQGFVNRAERLKAGNALLSAGVVKHPEQALRTALPDNDVKVRKWGLRYFGSNWVRYQVVLEADIKRGDKTTKCREVSTKTPVGAPTLGELRDNDGAELQAQLNKLISACISEVTNPTP